MTNWTEEDLEKIGRDKNGKIIAKSKSIQKRIKCQTANKTQEANMKINHSFTIFGNQENIKDNPIPYHRTTQKSKWTPAHKRYEAYKSYVVSEYAKSYRKGKFKREILVLTWKDGKPINTTLLHRVETIIYYVNLKSKKRGDPENIRKGILDALFVDDLEVIGGVPMRFEDKDNPRVEIEITYIEE